MKMIKNLKHCFKRFAMAPLLSSSSSLLPPTSMGRFQNCKAASTADETRRKGVRRFFSGSLTPVGRRAARESSDFSDRSPMPIDILRVWWVRPRATSSRRRGCVKLVLHLRCVGVSTTVVVPSGNRRPVARATGHTSAPRFCQFVFKN
jgi:hypothetical protein